MYKSMNIFLVACTTDEGVDYTVGQSIETSCSQRIVCRPGGEFETVEQNCTFVGQGFINGDPHYLTYDGAWHHFQGICEYVITKLCDSNDFVISAKNDGHGHNPSVSCVSQVTISIPGQNLTILLGRPGPGTLKINNTQRNNNLDEIYYNENGVRVERIGGYPNVFLNTHGVRIFYDGTYGVRIFVAARLAGNLCGLLGNYNGDSTDDFMTPDGRQVTSVDEFGNSWLVPSATPDCMGIGKRNAPGLTACSSDPAVIAQAKSRCNVTRQGPFSPCNGVVDPTSFIENCEFDYCCCSEEEREDCYCDNLVIYAAACAKAGRPPSNWRSLYCRKL